MTRKPGMRGGRVWLAVAVLLGTAGGLAAQDSTPLDPVLEELVLQAETLRTQRRQKPRFRAIRPR